MKYALITLLITAGSIAAVAAKGELTAPAAPSCESLTSLKLPHTTITLAQMVGPGAFTPPTPTGGPPTDAQAFRDLPAFCRVAATLKPSTDSDIKIEVWMPASGWNAKFMGVGNGGFSGAVAYGGLAAALGRGYAVASTDTGHQSSVADASWALGHPEKQIDFGYRAVHEMTLRAKTIVAAFYSATPRYAYWNGCSSGGKQGLKEAQRFPDDYDGIIAGAPANNWTHLSAQILWVAQAARAEPADVIPQVKYGLIHHAVLAQCDALDGVKDGILEDPRRCPFNPDVLQCKGEDAESCLTVPQVAALTRAYAQARNPRTGEEIYPGLSIGSELGWARLPQPFGIAETHYKYIVAKDPAWDFRAFNLDSDVAKADAIDLAGGQFRAVDPDLTAFKKRGGKLLQYHGWNDQQISPQNSINYYETVVRRLGSARATEDFYRLFMVPGMRHCRGGDEGATDQFDAVSALEHWVERHVAPNLITASHITNGVVERTRPLCPYPQAAVYKGRGSTDDAESFVCQTR
jgi:feruloyl esterase